ncbi:MAG: hypothetical protein ACKO96_23270, partial [Flammeovirgaceae bacterium]
VFIPCLLFTQQQHLGALFWMISEVWALKQNHFSNLIMAFEKINFELIEADSSTYSFVLFRFACL